MNLRTQYKYANFLSLCDVTEFWRAGMYFGYRNKTNLIILL